ncbi:lytic transglycosylase domain-containing protein [Propionivibrio sp.]|uniref:lytic transglycosylase domain-containing protein n=1 Tax=Propionivibrio sp. TaxID=2212460 RepID=UPI003BF443BC
MSATITLNKTMARSTDAALNFIQHFLMIAALFLVLGLINVFASRAQSFEILKSAFADFSITKESTEESVFAEPAKEPVVVEPAPVTLSPRMQGALDYVTRRYRVSEDALVPVFKMAQLIGKERRIDPLLIVAIIGIESRFNPFAESPMGAQGLMQIIPRFHKDKVPRGSGAKPLLDPVINIRVGVHVLDEAIRRGGGLVAGLQQYAGSSDPEQGYANKVLAEKERLEQAARRNPGPNA